MAGRIRTIKPELLEDERAAGLSHEAFRLFIGCMLLADDYGNLRASPAFLRAQVFWGQAAPIDSSLEELVSAGMVQRYEVAGQQYLALRNWAKHQKVDRPGKPRVPGPEAREDSPGSREDVAKARVVLATDPDPHTYDRQYLDQEGERAAARVIPPTTYTGVLPPGDAHGRTEARDFRGEHYPIRPGDPCPAPSAGEPAFEDSGLAARRGAGEGGDPHRGRGAVAAPVAGGADRPGPADVALRREGVVRAEGPEADVLPGQPSQATSRCRAGDSTPVAPSGGETTLPADSLERQASPSQDGASLKRQGSPEHAPSRGTGEVAGPQEAAIDIHPGRYGRETPTQDSPEAQRCAAGDAAEVAPGAPLQAGVIQGRGGDEPPRRVGGPAVGTAEAANDDPHALGTGPVKYTAGVVVEAGSTPAGPTGLCGLPDGASELTADKALGILKEAAGDRLALPRAKVGTGTYAAGSATGLAPGRQESDWVTAWQEARGRGYGEADLRKLGQALRERLVWDRQEPLAAGQLARSGLLLDLLAKVDSLNLTPSGDLRRSADRQGRREPQGTRNRPTWTGRTGPVSIEEIERRMAERAQERGHVG